jgi:hypothetical protein
MALEGITVSVNDLIIGIAVLAIGLILWAISPRFTTPANTVCVILGIIAAIIGFVIIILAFI